MVCLAVWVQSVFSSEDVLWCTVHASTELGAGLCWKEYLRKCIENNSIELPADCTEAERQPLGEGL